MWLCAFVRGGSGGEAEEPPVLLSEPMSTSQYLLGAAELAVIAAALGLGAYHLRALLVPAWVGALARLAEVVIGITMLILVSELLGVLGLFKEVPLLIGYVAAGLGATYLARRRGLPELPR